MMDGVDGSINAWIHGACMAIKIVGKWMDMKKGRWVCRLIDKYKNMRMGGVWIDMKIG